MSNMVKNPFEVAKKKKKRGRRRWNL